MGDRKSKSKKPSDLNESDFLGIVMQLVIKVDNKGLSDIQKILVNGFRQGLTYDEIAEKNYLNSENLRKEANKKLFPLISKALTEAMKTPIEVQKTNFITLIEHWNAIDNKGISVENSFVKSKTKINIFTELKNNLSRQQQSELNRIIKSYLPDNDNANFEKIIDKIIDSPDKDSLIILFRLTQDSRVNSSTCSKIEQTIQDLKELLKITDTDYNAVVCLRPVVLHEGHSYRVEVVVIDPDHLEQIFLIRIFIFVFYHLLSYIFIL